MYDLPITIEIDGTEYPIRNKGDYRAIIDCIAVLNDFELDLSERIAGAMVIFYGEENIPFDLETAAKEMMKFISGGEESNGKPRNIKLIDWEQDSAMIVSGVNKVMGREVRALDYCHWYTFLAAFMEIGESQLSAVVNIRNKIARGKKLEKHEQEFKRDHIDMFVWKNKNENDLKEIKQIWKSTK